MTYKNKFGKEIQTIKLPNGTVRLHQVPDPFTKQCHDYDLGISYDDFHAGIDRWQTMPIQNAFPTLDADKREIIMTGIRDWPEPPEED